MARGSWVAVEVTEEQFELITLAVERVRQLYHHPLLDVPTALTLIARDALRDAEACPEAAPRSDGVSMGVSGDAPPEGENP